MPEDWLLHFLERHVSGLTFAPWADTCIGSCISGCRALDGLSTRGPDQGTIRRPNATEQTMERCNAAHHERLCIGTLLYTSAASDPSRATDPAPSQAPQPVLPRPTGSDATCTLTLVPEYPTICYCSGAARRLERLPLSGTER